MNQLTTVRRSLPETVTERLSLARYEAMRHAITECHDVDEVLQQRASATVLAEAYARIANDSDSARKCEEIRRRAERRCGEMLAKIDKAKGSQGQGRPPKGVSLGGRSTRPPKGATNLADIGINKDQSSDWQKLAKVPASAFEEAVTRPGPVPSARQIVHEQKKKPKPTAAVDEVDPKALWLWGQLNEFAREGVLDMDPNALLRTMLEHMSDTTKELAPRVAAWLGRIKP